MKISVCASYTYYYDVEVPDSLCEKNYDGDLVDESSFLDYVMGADPTYFYGTKDVTAELISICENETGDRLYVSC